MSTWPYDAAQHDPLTALRIPVVPTYYPDWHYLIAVCVSDEDIWKGLRPDDAEVRMLQSELAYELEWYNPGYIAKMAARPFDLDGGFNSLLFVKHAPGSWGYRRRTWEWGLQIWPPRAEPRDLLGVLDHIHHVDTEFPTRRWLAWKAERPEIFGAGVAA